LSRDGSELLLDGTAHGISNRVAALLRARNQADGQETQADPHDDPSAKQGVFFRVFS
jgi:hypothetical protein